MADPITIMAAVSMGTAIAGAGVGALGAYQEGKALQNAANYKAAVARENARYQLLAGEVAAQRQGMKTRYETGQARAAQGASNLDVNVGSAPLVRESIHSVGLQEQGITRSEFARRAYGYEAEATLDVASGKQARKAAEYNVAKSILGGASSVSDKWMQGYQMGAWG